MSEIKLPAETRTQFGKGAARKIRRDHKIPAVMYGHGADPVHITLAAHETMKALKTSNALLTIVLDGKEQLALAKDVQRDPIKPVIEHIDLVIVRKGEKVTVDVPVHIEGDAAPDTIVTTDSTASSSRSRPPTSPRASPSRSRASRPARRSSRARSSCPRAPTLITDAETLVVNVTATMSQAELDADARRGRGRRRGPAHRRRVSTTDRVRVAGRRAGQPRSSVRRQPTQRRSLCRRGTRPPVCRWVGFPAVVSRAGVTTTLDTSRRTRRGRMSRPCA
jgi:large subunit ribosomal protein L25